MKKSIFWLLIFFIVLTTYSPKKNLISEPKLSIKKIIITDNSILETIYLKNKLSYLYDENLIFLKIDKLKNKIREESFIDSFSIRKIYPDTIKIKISEKKPVAILQNKKEKFYISSKGDHINYIKIKKYENLPTVFGSGENFYSFYKDLKGIKFPLTEIKSFYFYESGRWDLILKNNKTIKLPVKDYVLSLQNFLSTRTKSEFDNYKLFDYRIKDQLILN